MATKEIDVQQNLIIAESIEDPETGYVGLGAKEDGLYRKLPGGTEKRLLVDGEGSAAIIDIPKLIIYKQDGKLFARWSSFNNQFLSHNPKIRLFRYSKNSSRNREWKTYFNRTSSSKMRMIGKLADGVTKTIEWVCPDTTNTPIEISIDLNEWALNYYGLTADGPILLGVRIPRKARPSLFLSTEDANLQPKFQSRIAATFGVGIVIDNPVADQRPYKIWDSVTEFKIAAHKLILPITQEIKIVKMILLR